MSQFYNNNSREFIFDHCSSTAAQRAESTAEHLRSQTQQRQSTASRQQQSSRAERESRYRIIIKASFSSGFAFSRADLEIF